MIEKKEISKIYKNKINLLKNTIIFTIIMIILKYLIEIMTF